MYVCSMQRITISLPDDLARVIAREAARHGTSVSEWVRSTLASCLGVGEREEPKPPPFAGLGRSGTRHTARDAEDILAREWNPDARRR